MTKYTSKIGVGLSIFIFGILGGLTILMIYQKTWSGLAIILTLTAFVVYLFANTNYTINGNTLKITSGFLVNILIDINTINSISETNNPISAPATSLDRLEIFYDRTNIVLVSPKDKMKFINHLKALNPEIEIVVTP